MAGEYEISPGRYLVGVSGYDEIGNDPAKVVGFLGEQVQALIKEQVSHGGLPPYQVEESGLIKLGRYQKVNYPPLGLKGVIDLDLLERFQALMLEIAFLEGDRQVLDSLKGVKQNG